MSTRQYIGARYVPKFSDPIEWDKNRGYEALEIVTYLGTSYTSKKPVPVGTEINNKEYWVVTGNYNAQVELYRQEVENVKNDVKELGDKLNSKITVFNSISDLLKSSLNVGDSVIVKSYYSEYTGSSIMFNITESGPENGYTVLKLNNNLYANLINPSKVYDVTKFGIVPGKVVTSDYVEDFLNILPSECAIYFPSGVYSISGNIVMPVSKRISIIGEYNDITNQDRINSTVLSFSCLKANTPAITLCPTRVLVKDIKISCNVYQQTEDRSKIGYGVDVYNTSVDVNNVHGIYSADNSYGCYFENVTVVRASGVAFRLGKYAIVRNCSVFNSNTGFALRNDCSISGCRIANVNIGITCDNAALSQISDIRMDSVKSSGIYIFKGSGLIIDNVNIDYCQHAGITANIINNCIITNIFGRCGTSYPCDTSKSTYLNESLNNKEGGAALINISGGVESNNNVIRLCYKISNPADSASTLLVPLNCITLTGDGAKTNLCIDVGNAPKELGVYDTPTTNLTREQIQRIVNDIDKPTIKCSCKMYGVNIIKKDYTLYQSTYALIG